MLRSDTVPAYETTQVQTPDLGVLVSLFFYNGSDSCAAAGCALLRKASQFCVEHVSQRLRDPAPLEDEQAEASSATRMGISVDKGGVLQIIRRLQKAAATFSEQWYVRTACCVEYYIPTLLAG